ncbi:glycoside hydrolase family 30 beta sandwich domain-containing protein [Mycetocola sp. 2940]|uniref:glycoside hydrolase family 30 protein n=1 Tax=Mycetocola sp. 2940 TaxID=3156452 RepID=UPI0033982C15
MSDTDRQPDRSRRRWLLLASGIAALLVILLVVTPRNAAPEVATPNSSPTSTPSPTASEVTAVTTSADGRDLMRPLDVDAQPASEGELTVSVDTDVEHQRVDGFGAAMTHASADLFAGMPADARADLLDELFDLHGPARLSTLRLPIGASDFVDTDAFTFDDLPAGETDWELDRFSVEPDRRAMIPVLQEVVAINPELRLIASPWSPPGWLKTNGSLEGGRLLDEDRAYETYAAYLVRFLEEYRDAGLDIDYLTVQNEPQLRYPDGYPGTDMPVWQQAKLIEELGPALEAAGFETSILGFDHNWELNPGDVATTPEGEDPAYLYPADLLNTAAAEWIDGIAFHCYYGNAGAQSRLWEQFREIEIWVTECSGSSAAGDSREKVFADTFSWQATNLLIDSLRNRAAGVLTWNLALDENNGPHRGGCSTCSGVVTIASDGTVTRNAEYYVLAHAARFVPPGSVRVDSNSGDGELRHVAFRTPDDSTVLLVWNPSGVPRSIDVGDGRMTVTAEVPAASLSTFEWATSVGE